LLARSQGSFQLLPNGNYFVGWGQVPTASEFGADGRLLFDLALPPASGSYRAYRFLWTGRPAESPRVAAAHSGRRVYVYMSWNGSTELAGWQILAGNSRGALRPVATIPATGFQTTRVVSSARYVKARALNASLQVLRVSRIVRVG
jgi:hypothetical protein